MRTLLESPPFTALEVPQDYGTLEYHSVPGRGVTANRRLDVSSALDLHITIERLIPGRDVTEHQTLWHVVLDGGVPLVYEVPGIARYDDLRLVIEPFPPADVEVFSQHHVYIGDHWSS